MSEDTDLSRIAERICSYYRLDNLVSNVINPDTNDTYLSNVIGVFGPSRCGKDTLSLLMSRITGHTYPGTCSINAAHLVWSAWQLVNNGEPAYERLIDFYADRHKYKLFWFNFLNALRDINPLVVPSLCLCNGNILTGVRSHKELVAVAPYLKACIWVERHGTPEDVTLEFDYSDCAKLFGNNCLVLTNPGDVRGLTERFLKIADRLPIKLQLEPKMIRYKTAYDLVIGV